MYQLECMIEFTMDMKGSWAWKEIYMKETFFGVGRNIEPATNTRFSLKIIS